LPTILLYQEDWNGRWIQLYLDIQRYIPPDLSLELWEYTYDALADCYLFDDTSDDIISYQHKLRFRLPSPIVHPCPTLIEKLEKVAEEEENYCLGTIAVEYFEFFKQPEHQGFREHELLHVPSSNPSVDVQLENPRTVEHEYFSGNHVYIPSPELSSDDTWNPDYWIEYEPIDWTTLPEPEELFEVHWSDIV
jgi:hypothetical protein